MNTGCKECDRLMIEKGYLCLKHEVERLKWCAESAQKDYKKAKTELETRQESERKQNETV